MIKCLKVLGGSRVRFARIGDVITASVLKASPHTQIREHTVVYAVIVRQKKEYGRADGSYIRFDENAAVILESRENENPLGTRIFGPVPRELKARGFSKIISLAPEVL